MILFFKFQNESCLKKLRVKHAKNILFGNLNENSLRNKFGYLEEIIKNMFDVFLLSECKQDFSFPDTQFQIANYNMFRKDRKKHWWSVVLCESRFKL